MTVSRADHVDTDGFVTCRCGKRGYAWRHTARRIRRRMRARGLHVYRCSASGMFHVGHMRPGATRDDYRPTPDPEDTP